MKVRPTKTKTSSRPSPSPNSSQKPLSRRSVTFIDMPSARSQKSPSPAPRPKTCEPDLVSFVIECLGNL